MVPEVNYVDINSENDVINDVTFSPLIQTVPRKADLHIITSNYKPEIKWSLAESFLNDTRDADEVSISPNKSLFSKKI